MKIKTWEWSNPTIGRAKNNQVLIQLKNLEEQIFSISDLSEDSDYLSEENKLQNRGDIDERKDYKILTEEKWDPEFSHKSGEKRSIMHHMLLQSEESSLYSICSGNSVYSEF